MPTPKETKGFGQDTDIELRRPEGYGQACFLVDESGKRKDEPQTEVEKPKATEIVKYALGEDPEIEERLSQTGGAGQVLANHMGNRV